MRTRASRADRRGGAYRGRVERALCYEELSHRYVATGDVCAAVHAVWAADLSAALAVIGERAVAVSLKPDDHVRTVTRSVADIFGAHLPEHDPRSADGAADAVRAVRRTLCAALDRRTQQALLGRFAGLAHLEGLTAVPAAASGGPATIRGEGSARTLAVRRRQTAVDCMAAAREFQRVGADADAVRMLWRSDWAAFGAYLLDAAQGAGDDRSTVVDLRWDLAALLTARSGALPTDLDAAAVVLRAGLSGALDPLEGQSLQSYFR